MIRLLALLLTLPLLAHAEAQLPLLPDQARAGFPAIGRVNVAGHRTRGMCSGTLVGPRRVLTAAHCVFRGDGRPVAVADLRFVAGWDRGVAVASAGVVRVELHPRAIKAGRIAPAYDLALLHLAHALAVDALPLAGRDLPPPPYALVAYEAARPHALGGRFDCDAKLHGLNMLRSPCAVEQGASGGPVLAQVDGVWRVLGVISARAGDGSTLIARVRSWDLLQAE